MMESIQNDSKQFISIIPYETDRFEIFEQIWSRSVHKKRKNKRSNSLNVSSFDK